MSRAIDPTSFAAVVFDLDGVITDTASVHLQAWRRLFDDFLQARAETATSEGSSGADLSPFTEEDYRRAVDGKPRRSGIRSFLTDRGIEVDDDTVSELAQRKNHYFLELLDQDGVTVFDSTVRLIHRLHLQGIRTAIFSASRNAGAVLERAGLAELFEVRVDGRTADELDLPGKPDPAVPLEAARRLGAEPTRTVIVEDAQAGVEAGRRGGFGLVIGVDRVGAPEALRQQGADLVVPDLAEVSAHGIQRPLSEVPGAADRWDAVSGLLRGQRVVIFLDFDGTLAPIVDDPDAAVAPLETREVIERLARRCTVAVVSGRDLRDVRSRVEIPGLWFVGGNGFELEGPDGEHHEQQTVDDALPALDDAEDRLRDELEEEESVQIERRHFAVAVHTRRADPDTSERAQRVVEQVALEHPKLRVTRGRAVSELRPDIAWDKGTALRWILDQIVDEEEDQRSTLAIYAGDDLTDEAALRAVRTDGLGIVVTNAEHGDRSTFAHVKVSGPPQLRELLERLDDVLGAA